MWKTSALTCVLLENALGWRCHARMFSWAGIYDFPSQLTLGLFSGQEICGLTLDVMMGVLIQVLPLHPS